MSEPQTRSVQQLMDLSGRTALVTGGSRGLGLQMAQALGEAGARLVISSRKANELEEAAEQLRADGIDVTPLAVDLADEDAVMGLADRALEVLGRVDILINNAGFRGSSSIAEMSTDEWRAAAAGNYDGPFFCTRAVVPTMISNGYGRIITVSGLNSFHGRPNWSHVCGSKMGAMGMTKALAVELARYNILVNHVVPGAYVAHPDLTRIPVGRIGLAQELANTYAFLASEDASYITGQTFHVNGGEIRG